MAPPNANPPPPVGVTQQQTQDDMPCCKDTPQTSGENRVLILWILCIICFVCGMTASYQGLAGFYISAELYSSSRGYYTLEETFHCGYTGYYIDKRYPYNKETDNAFDKIASSGKFYAATVFMGFFTLLLQVLFFFNRRQIIVLYHKYLLYWSIFVYVLFSIAIIVYHTTLHDYLIDTWDGLVDTWTWWPEWVMGVSYFNVVVFIVACILWKAILVNSCKPKQEQTNVQPYPAPAPALVPEHVELVTRNPQPTAGVAYVQDPRYVYNTPAQ
jgi:hypothetical protein